MGAGGLERRLIFFFFRERPYFIVVTIRFNQKQALVCGTYLLLPPWNRVSVIHETYLDALALPFKFQSSILLVRGVDADGATSDAQFTHGLIIHVAHGVVIFDGKRLGCVVPRKAAEHAPKEVGHAHPEFGFVYETRRHRQGDPFPPNSSTTTR